MTPERPETSRTRVPARTRTRALARTRPPGGATERGAALLVAMVLIFMLSVLGASSMRGATLEGRLADNALAKEMTFQAAESSADRLLRRDDVLESVVCGAPLEDEPFGAANLVAAQETFVDLADRGATHVPGYSIDQFGARRFEVVGRSELATLDTETVIVQGVVVIGAADRVNGDC